MLACRIHVKLSLCHLIVTEKCQRKVESRAMIYDPPISEKKPVGELRWAKGPRGCAIPPQKCPALIWCWHGNMNVYMDAMLYLKRLSAM